MCEVSHRSITEVSMDAPKLKGKKEKKIRKPKRKHKKEIWMSDVVHMGEAPGEPLKLRLRKVVPDVSRKGEMLNCWKI